MNLVKHCPACGQTNPEQEIFCASCGNDISQVKSAKLAAPEPPPTASAAPVAHPASASPTANRAVKMCPKCGTENEAFAILCGHAGCGETIDVIAVIQRGSPTSASRAPEPPPSAAPTVVPQNSAPPKLLLLVGQQTFECRSGDVLGRAGNLACHVFAGIQTVSARHAALELRAGIWHVVNLPLPPDRTAKNLTALDNREIPPGQSAPLTAEHVLKISTRCEVRLRVVSE